MVTVSIDYELPGGAPASRMEATVTARTGPAGAALEDRVVGQTRRISLDADGHAEIDLDPVDVAGETIVWQVRVGNVTRHLDLSGAAGPVSWADPAVLVIGGPAPTDWVPVQGEPGVVAATGLATYDAEAQTIDVTATAADVGAPPTARTITAGTGLAGGGDLSADRTISADLSSSNGAALGVAAPGVVTTIARADHVHPMPSAVDVGAEAVGVAAARTQVGTLAGRPSAAALTNGVRYFATDDGGGTLWVVSSGAWVQAAPAVNGVARLLDIAEPAASFTQVIGAANTDYRLSEMTIDFVMPAQRVRIDLGPMLIYQGAVSTTPRPSIWYSVDAWANKSCIMATTPPDIAGTAPFYIHGWNPRTVWLPTSIAAGTSVSVALFVATASGTPTLSFGATPTGDRTTTLRPFISATAC